MADDDLQQQLLLVQSQIDRLGRARDYDGLDKLYQEKRKLLASLSAQEHRSRVTRSRTRTWKKEERQ